MPSSIQLFNQAISDFKRLQDVLNTKQSKIGADSKASTFAELGDDITSAQSYTLSAERSSRYINSINTASSRNDTLSQAIAQLIELAQSFKQDVTLENSSAGASVNDLTAQANAALDNIRGALNQKDGSNYVFSGSKTNTEPVGDLKLSSNIINSTPTANYYNGDDFTLAVDVSATLRIDYGINASNPAFKNLIGAINLAKQQEQDGTGNYAEAGEMLDTAIDQLTTLQAKIGENGKLFDSSLQYQQTAKDTFENKFNDINAPDVVQLTIEVSQAQATLEASFMNFSRISQVSLTNYL